MLKEQVALRDKIQRIFVWMLTDGLTPKEAVEEILNLFKAEVDKLTVIDMRTISGRVMADGSKRKQTITYSPKYFSQNKIQLKVTAKAQLQHTKKELLDLVGEV